MDGACCFICMEESFFGEGNWAFFFGWDPPAVGNGMDNGSRKGKLEWVYCFYGNFLWKFCITVFRYRYADRLKMTGDGMDILV